MTTCHNCNHDGSLELRAWQLCPERRERQTSHSTRHSDSPCLRAGHEKLGNVRDINRSRISTSALTLSAWYAGQDLCNGRASARLSY